MQKGPFPQKDLAENLCVDSQTSPGSKSKSLQMGTSRPKNIVKAGGVRHRFKITNLGRIGELFIKKARMGSFFLNRLKGGVFFLKFEEFFIGMNIPHKAILYTPAS